MTFSPDGRLLAVGITRSQTLIFDATTGVQLQALGGTMKIDPSLLNSSLDEVAFSPNGRLLASKSRGEVDLWDTNSGEFLQTLSAGYVHLMAFSPDGILLAVVTAETLKLWDVATGVAYPTRYRSRTRIRCLRFSPDGAQVILVSELSEIEWWERTSDRVCKSTLARVIPEAFDSISSTSGLFGVASLSPDGSLLAAFPIGTTTGGLWDTASGDNVCILEGHLQPVIKVVFSTDGQMLATSDGKTTRLWGVQLEQGIRKLQVLRGVINAMTSLSSGSLLALSINGDVTLWDINSRDSQGGIDLHPKRVTQVAISHCGTMVATVFDDYTIKVGTLTGDDELQELDRILGYMPHKIWFLNNNIHLVWLEIHDTGGHCVYYWDVTSGENPKRAQRRILSDITWSGFAVPSPCGNLLALRAYLPTDDNVELWDLSTGEIKNLYHYPFVLAGAFSPTGEVLALASQFEGISLWDTNTGSLLRTIIDVVPTSFDYRSKMDCIVFSDDGVGLAVLFNESTVMLLSTTTGETLRKFNIGTEVLALSLSLDNPRLERSQQSRYGTSLENPTTTTDFPDGIIVTKNWIAQGTGKLIWLPPEYRPRCATIRGNTVVLGLHSGRVCSLEFNS